MTGDLAHVHELEQRIQKWAENRWLEERMGNPFHEDRPRTPRTIHFDPGDGNCMICGTSLAGGRPPGPRHPLVPYLEQAARDILGEGWEWEIVETVGDEPPTVAILRGRPS